MSFYLLNRSAACFVIFIVMINFLSCSNQKKKIYTIGYIQITDDPVLDEARNGVIEALDGEGFSDGKNISIIYKNAQGDLSNIPIILQSFMNDDVDMVITSSTPCMAAACQFIKNIPVVFTVAFSPQQVGIKNKSKNLTGVYDELNMEKFVNVIKEVKPEIKKIGIIYNSSEQNALFGRDKLKAECSKREIELTEAAIVSASEVLQAASSLAYKNVEAFAVIADNSVNLALESVIRVSYKNKIPIFNSEASQVVKGALVGFGLDYKMWGKESGKIAARIIKGEKPENISVAPLKNTKLVLNNISANNIGIKFSRELVAKADSIIW